MNIEIIRHPDCEGNDNRGFSIDALELLVNDKPAGYLMIAHIPFHRVLQWGSENTAEAALEFQAAMRQTTREELLASGERLCKDPLVSPEEVENAWCALDGRGNIDGGGNVTFHVDRPYVDYIRVYEPGDFTRDIPPLRFKSYNKGNLITENHRKQGLGILMYVEGSKWMAERGMPLHGSSLQSPEAKKSWGFLMEKFPHAVRKVLTVPHRGEDKAERIILDGSLLDDWRPDNSTVTISKKPPGRNPDTNNLEDLKEISYMNKEQDMSVRFNEMDAEQRSRGIEPMGGEYYPSSPAEALELYKQKMEFSYGT